MNLDHAGLGSDEPNGDQLNVNILLGSGKEENKTKPQTSHCPKTVGPKKGREAEEGRKKAVRMSRSLGGAGRQCAGHTIREEVQQQLVEGEGARRRERGVGLRGHRRKEALLGRVEAAKQPPLDDAPPEAVPVLMGAGGMAGSHPGRGEEKQGVSFFG